MNPPRIPSQADDAPQGGGGRDPDRAPEPAALEDLEGEALDAEDAEEAADAAEDAAEDGVEGDGELEEEDRPDPKLSKAKVPTHAEMLEALQWAFEREDSVRDGVLERYAEHALLVLEGNKQLNLTAIVDPREVAVKHYLDSWRATRYLTLVGRTVLDLGTGAGFPGAPMALCEPNCNVTLLDARRKRAEFVQSTLEALRVPNAKAEWGRGEEYLVRNKADVVMVRALSSVRENVRLLRKVRHSIRDLVMFKGPSWSREVRAAEREADRLGFALDTVWEHELPGEMGQRALLVYRAPGSH